MSYYTYFWYVDLPSAVGERMGPPPHQVLAPFLGADGANQAKSAHTE